MKKLLLSCVLIAPSAFAATPSLTGPWAIHGSVSGVDWDQQCKFVLTDKKLTGTCKTGEKEFPITGSVDGNKLAWTQPGEYDGGPITLTFTATLDDSGKIAGKVDVEPYSATGEFTAAPSKETGTPKDAAAK